MAEVREVAKRKAKVPLGAIVTYLSGTIIFLVMQVDLQSATRFDYETIQKMLGIGTFAASNLALIFGVAGAIDRSES